MPGRQHSEGSDAQPRALAMSDCPEVTCSKPTGRCSPTEARSFNADGVKRIREQIQSKLALLGVDNFPEVK